MFQRSSRGLRGCGLIAGLLVLPGIVLAQDSPVEALWRQWKESGDQQARAKLIELGPEARELAHRILHPPGKVFPAAPEIDEWSILAAMNADAVPAMARGVEEHFTENRDYLINHLKELGPRARGAGDALLKVALRESGPDRMAALAALAAARTKMDYVIPELSRLAAFRQATCGGLGFPGPSRSRRS